MAQAESLKELFNRKLRDQWLTSKPSRKIHRKRDDSGIIGIRKVYADRYYNQNFYFEYYYYPEDDTHRKYIYRKNLIDLYYAIISDLGREIVVEDVEKVRNFIDENVNNSDDYRFLIDKLVEGV